METQNKVSKQPELSQRIVKLAKTLQQLPKDKEYLIHLRKNRDGSIFAKVQQAEFVTNIRAGLDSK